MRPPFVVLLLLAAIALAAIGIAGGIAWITLAAPEGERAARFVAGAGVGALLIAAMCGLIWTILQTRLMGPLAELAREIETLSHTRQERTPRLPRFTLMPGLVRAVEDLLRSRNALRRDTGTAVAAATARAHSDRQRLEAILIDLAEGVIVCNRQHRVLLYNRAAARILESPEPLGLGRLVFNIVSREPVMRALEPMLRAQATAEGAPPPANFACLARQSGGLLRARLRLIADTDDDAGGYVLSFGALADPQSVPTDLHSVDLFQALAWRLAEAKIAVTPVGLPRWLRADGQLLLAAFANLIQAIARDAGATAFDIEAAPGADAVPIDVSWHGPCPIRAALDAWLDAPLAGDTEASARKLLGRHCGDITCVAAGNGRTRLRVSLQQLASPAEEPQRRLPPRPEFYDFDLFATQPEATLQDTPVTRLRCVVFDTETTGLRPSEGDEIVSIGAVRVVNGRVLTGETFDRIVNPGRLIPAGSIAFHGITQDMVRDRPPAHVVLPQFKAFVGRSVLVAYNAAFDLKFLELKRKDSGVDFDNVVLDALLLGAFLNDGGDHSLEALANRYGVTIAGRHTALGDAMATAAIFVAMMDPLQARGVVTLRQALQASSRMVGIRAMQDQF